MCVFLTFFLLGATPSLYMAGPVVIVTFPAFISSPPLLPTPTNGDHVIHNGQWVGLPYAVCCALTCLAMGLSRAWNLAIFSPQAVYLGMGCTRPEKGHLFLILIKAPSACQAVHLQGCLYLVGKLFAHLYKGYGAIWTSTGPANERTPHPLPQWLLHGWTRAQICSIRILPWTFVWQLACSIAFNGKGC